MERCCSYVHHMYAWPCWAHEDSNEKCRYLFTDTEDASADSVLLFCCTAQTHCLCEIFARNTKTSTSAYAICMDRQPYLMHYLTAEDSVSAASSAFLLQQCDCEAEFSSHSSTLFWSSGGCECTGWKRMLASLYSSADEQFRTDTITLSNTKTSTINSLSANEDNSVLHYLLCVSGVCGVSESDAF